MDEIVDVNVYLGRWPFRRLPHDETPALVAKLRQMRVAQAWAGSLEGVFQKDLSAVNARLAEECRRYGEGLLVPFGAINLALPDWREDLRRCAADHQMPGVRLHPNYHGYTVADPRFSEFLDAAAEHRLLVQIAVKMEDERTQHPLARAPAVDVEPLAALLGEHRGSYVVLLNALKDLRAETIDRLAATGRVSFDLAMLEGVAGVERLLKTLPLERLLFGSYFPLFYFEAASLKLRESQLGSVQQRAIRRENARRIFSAVRS